MCNFLFLFVGEYGYLSSNKTHIIIIIVNFAFKTRRCKTTQITCAKWRSEESISSTELPLHLLFRRTKRFWVMCCLSMKPVSFSCSPFHHWIKSLTFHTILKIIVLKIFFINAAAPLKNWWFFIQFALHSVKNVFLTGTLGHVRK